MGDTLYQLERRVNDHDKLHEEHHRRLADHTTLLRGYGEMLTDHAAQIKAQASLIDALTKNTEAQVRLFDIGEKLLIALGWVPRFLRWLGWVIGALVAIKVAVLNLLYGWRPW